MFQELVEEETRGKLAAQSKLRQEADEKEALKERLDEEEENRRAFEKQIQDLQQKVGRGEARRGGMSLYGHHIYVKLLSLILIGCYYSYSQLF